MKIYTGCISSCYPAAQCQHLFLNEPDDLQKGGIIQTAKERQLFSTQEFIKIAKEAVSKRYHLSAQQASSMTIHVDENSPYAMLDSTLCYRCYVFVGEFSTENTEQDGTYTVYMNLETGIVEDIMFLSEQGGGNG